MADKKTEKKKDKVDVRDLKPNKDAKGGFRGPRKVESSIKSVQSSGRSVK